MNLRECSYTSEYLQDAHITVILCCYQPAPRLNTQGLLDLYVGSFQSMGLPISCRGKDSCHAFNGTHLRGLQCTDVLITKLQIYTLA